MVHRDAWAKDCLAIFPDIHLMSRCITLHVTSFTELSPTLLLHASNWCLGEKECKHISCGHGLPFVHVAKKLQCCEGGATKVKNGEQRARWSCMQRGRLLVQWRRSSKGRKEHCWNIRWQHLRLIVIIKTAWLTKRQHVHWKYLCLLSSYTPK